MEATATKATFSKYPDYKDSGVEWLGVIPEHWQLLSNKNIFKLKKELVGKKSADYTLLSLTLKGIIQRDLDNGGKFPAEFDTYQEVKKGDFIFCLFDVEETPRCVGLSDFEGMITGAYTVMVVNSKFDKEFLYYFYLNLDADKRLRPLYTGLRNTISKDNFFAFKTFVPPKEEQTAIAKFLDDKTSKIDRVIAQKEKMIVLLKERKQIIIQNAVTKGLNPSAKMKNSGVEWIGEIPEHWEVEKLKHIFFEKKKTFNPNLNCGSISYGEVVYKDDEKIPESTKASYQELLCGEFLINPLNLNYDLVSLRIGLSEIDVVVSPGYLILKPHKIIEKKYFKYLLHRYDVAYMKLLGAGVRQTISFNHISNSLLVIPTISEQNAIVAHIETQSAQIDKAIKLQEQQIEKLKELKSTLIDSAVTGKIKVS